MFKTMAAIIAGTLLFVGSSCAGDITTLSTAANMTTSWAGWYDSDCGDVHKCAICGKTVYEHKDDSLSAITGYYSCGEDAFHLYSEYIVCESCDDKYEDRYEQMVDLVVEILKAEHNENGVKEAMDELDKLEERLNEISRKIKGLR